jgi:hypothetical protein
MLSLLPLGILTTLPALGASPEAPAPAPALPTVAVVGLHQASLDAADQDRAIAALVKAIEATGRFDARDLNQVAAAVRGRERVVLEEGLLKTARQSLSNGRTAAAQANWDEARSWLTAAVQDFERVIPGANSTDELWEAHVLIGATWVQQDAPDEAAARAAFGSAVALNPQRPIDPAQYPPSVTDLYGAVQQERTAQAATVSFTGRGTLWVDGTEHGALPTDVPGLVPGAHHALARGDGAQAYVRFDVPVAGPVDLPAGAPSLGAPAEGTAARAAQTSALYTALGKRSEGLQYVLVGDRKSVV